MPSPAEPPPVSPASDPAAFLRWMRDPARTNEELLLAGDLTEQARAKWAHREGINVPYDQRSAERQRDERFGNPAYRRQFTPAELEGAAQMLEQVEGYYECGPLFIRRPLRNLAALAHFPGLRSFNAETQIGAAQAAFLSSLPLESLTLTDEFLQDFRFLAGLTKLRDLNLRIRSPWVTLPSLAGLPALQKVQLRLNLLNLPQLERLPAAVEVHLEGTPWNTPLRSLADAPEMPEARRLLVEFVADLHGLRAPKLLNLVVSGPYTDLSPLAGLEELTSLELYGDRFTDLSPLARLPNLRRLYMGRQTAVDLSPLAEAPQLHEVTMKNCPVLQVELAALNAALPPWAEAFSEVPPRPLQPWEFYSYSSEDSPPEVRWNRSQRRRERRSELDQEMIKAEENWLEGVVRARLDKLLGPGWGDFSASGSMLALQRESDMEQLEALIDLLRTISAGCKRPKLFWLIVELKTNTQLREEAEDEERDEERDEAEEREFQKRLARDRQAQLERQYRFELQEQSGLPIDPQAFSPRAGQEDKPEVVEEAKDVLEAKEEERLGELYTQLHVTEHHVWVRDHMAAPAERLLLRKAKPWANDPDEERE